MTELQKKIAEASSRLLLLHKERADREATILAYESAARDERLTVHAIKREIDELSAILRHADIQKASEEATLAATKAKEAAEKAEAEANAKLTEAEAMLEKLLKEKE